MLPAADLDAVAVIPACEDFVLPPYPGELGIEIRYFLARVEPWLRAGWKILARRPELYPEGSAVLDDSLTAAENRLFSLYGAVRLATGPKIVSPARGPFNRARAVVANAKARQLQQEWRQLLRPYLSNRLGRPWTCWDRDLTTVATEFIKHSMWKHGSALPPSYLPPAFVSEDQECTYPEHVGVQFRAVRYNPDGRNSDVATVLAEAQAVAADISLPLLVYGDAAGCALPEGTCTTASLGEGRLLRRELGYLRSCRLMLAPNSGWADLMCWLRIPVLIERTEPLTIFDMMASFGAQMLIRQPEVPVQEQADELLNTGGMWRSLGREVVDPASLDEWVSEG
jgi:hypothetical protein